MTKGYVGWLLPHTERNMLLDRFAAKFSQLIAHHCTWQFGVDDSQSLPQNNWGWVVGESVDPDGVQALVLLIGGSSKRPDGGTLHITWSLTPGRKPVESNQVIAQFGIQPVDPIRVRLEPKFFSFN
jgi:hypothetical protein